MDKNILRIIEITKQQHAIWQTEFEKAMKEDRLAEALYCIRRQALCLTDLRDLVAEYGKRNDSE